MNKQSKPNLVECKLLKTIAMKNLLLLLAFAITSTIACAQTQGNVYAEKSGKVVYQYEIDGEKTDFTLIFDDFGKKQVMDIITKDNGEAVRVKTVITEESMFMVNYADKQVIIFPVTGDDNSMNLAPGADMGIDVDALVDNATNTGATKIGTETLLGKECMIFEHSDGEYKGKYWIHDNYLVKAEFISEGIHTYMEAKELKIGIAVSASEFEIPTGFAVTDMAKQMQQMQQMMGMPEGE